MASQKSTPDSVPIRHCSALSAAEHAPTSRSSTRHWSACTSHNVAQMMQALDAIFRRQSLALRHDFTSGLLILDADITGLPCGKKAEGSMKGYSSQFGRNLG